VTSPAEFDYIIVGGGSAGAIVANRLSADPKLRVLLLEAGPADRDSDWTVRMPAAMGINFERAKYNYLYNSEPEPYLNGRQVFHPRGKILGGSSSINGMCYTRGNPNDYERWVSEGAAGWSYADVLPYFKRLESFEGGDDLYRGRSGPVKVRNGPLSFSSYNTFLAAGEQAGYPRTADINGPQQEGFGLFDRNTDDGIRASTSWAYLRPVRGRKNLSIITEATADKVLVEEGRARGVAYIQRGLRKEARARREVILSAGAFNSPQILLRSGIGPGEALRKAGIALVHELAGVGRNLQDHLEFYLCWTCPPAASLNPRLTKLSKALIGLRWMLTRKGLGESNHDEAVAFVRSEAALGYPDTEMQFMPFQTATGYVPQPSPAGFSIAICHQRPKSRGQVEIPSADPLAAPHITFNYLSTEFDRQKAITCVRIARNIVAQRAFDGVRGEELRPGPDTTSDEAVLEFCRNTGTSGFHPSGTCRMGPKENAQSVVDSDGRLQGVEGLRVIDASVFPSVTTGNTNVPVMMVAEKLADAILGRKLDPLKAPFAGRLGNVQLSVAKAQPAV